MAHGFDAGDGVNQEVGMAAHSGDPAAAAYAEEEAARAEAIAKATAAAPPPGGQMAKALFDHEPDEPDELPFKAGDMIKVTEKDEAGEWWTGEFDGNTGMPVDEHLYNLNLIADNLALFLFSLVRLLVIYFCTH